MLAKAAQTVAAVVASLSPAPAQESVDAAVLNSLRAPQAAASATAQSEPGQASSSREALQKALQDPAPAGKDKPAGPKTTPVTIAPAIDKDKQDPSKPATPDAKPAEQTQGPKPASTSGADLLRRAQRNQEKQAPGSEPSAEKQSNSTPAPAGNPQTIPTTPATGATQVRAQAPAAQQQPSLAQLMTMTSDQFLKLSPEQATQALSSANKALIVARKDSAALISELELYKRITALLDANREDGGPAQFSALQEIRTALNGSHSELEQRAKVASEREKEKQATATGPIPQQIAEVVRHVTQQRDDLAREIKEHDAGVVRRREEFMRDYGRELNDLAREKQEARGGIGQIDRLINGKPNAGVSSDDPAAKILNGIQPIPQDARYKDSIALALTQVDPVKVTHLIMGGGVIDTTPKGSARDLAGYFEEAQRGLRFEMETIDALRGTRQASERLVGMVTAAPEKEKVSGEVRALLKIAGEQYAKRQEIEGRERDLGVKPGELTELQWRGLEAWRQIEVEATQIGRAAFDSGRNAGRQKFDEAGLERDKAKQDIRREIEDIRRSPLGNGGIIRIGNG